MRNCKKCGKPISRALLCDACREAKKAYFGQRTAQPPRELTPYEKIVNMEANARQESIDHTGSKKQWYYYVPAEYYALRREAGIKGRRAIS